MATLTQLLMILNSWLSSVGLMTVHTQEPGCAVQAAIQAGSLSEDRLDNYRALLNEATTNQNLRGKARENAKVERMFGSKKQMKAIIKARRKNRR